MATLLSLSSTSSSLLLRKTPHPNPRFLSSSSFKPSPLPSRRLPPISASLLSPPALFFARIPSGGSISSPLAVLASAMAKWLDLYGLVLMLRVLLSWFPNLPWEKQPFVAIRDICDPYLSLFRRIIPVFGGLDLSPILAFAVLGFLSKTITGAII